MQSADRTSFLAKRKRDYEYPTFRPFTVRHECLNSVSLPRLRTNSIVVKLYTPGGFTESGLFVEPKKGPPIWAHILAFHPDVRNYTHIDLTPGDMILFHRYADDVILETEELTLSIIHIKSVQALFSPPLVEFKCIS
jgi:hypothetical protein